MMKLVAIAQVLYFTLYPASHLFAQGSFLYPQSFSALTCATRIFECSLYPVRALATIFGMQPHLML